MPRPNRDRVMVSFYLARSGKAEIMKLAEKRGETQADTLRAMLAYAKLNMPTRWSPDHAKPAKIDSKAAKGKR